MPQVDKRRVQGPESSRDYKSYASLSKALLKDGKRSIRHDNRSAGDHRSVYFRTGVISQARGSAYVEQGDTKIMCGVYGPREIPRRSDFSMKGVLSCSFDRAPFASPKRLGYGNSRDESEEKELAITLKEALEATVCMKRLGNLRLTDPTLLEEENDTTNSSAEETTSNETACLTIGYLPSSEQISCLLQEGFSDPEILVTDINHLKTVSADLLPNVTKCLVDSVKLCDQLKSEKQ